PAGLSMVEAGAVPETFFTVWTNVFERGRLKSGETFLLHGGYSGIGTTAIQLDSAFRAMGFATDGNNLKCQACEKLGAEKGINYREEDFVEIIQQATNKRGVDVILDMVGGDYIEKNISLLATEGRLVTFAYLR